MILHLFLKRTYSFVLIIKGYLVEFLDTRWLHEYDIEKYKFNFLKNFFFKTPVIFIKNKNLNFKNTALYIYKIFIIKLNKKLHLSRSIFVLYACLFYFILSIFYNFYIQFFFKNFFFLLILVFFFYFFITTYFHFSKTYNLNKYNSQNQRFWKRTFGVFWALEFNLFFIYMYLTLISPSELPMLTINYKEIITGINTVQISTQHLFFLSVLVFINFCYICLIFLKKKKNYHLFNIILFLLNFAYCYVLYFEFLKFYYVAGWGTHSTYNFNKSVFLNNEYNVIYNNNNSTNNIMHFKIPNFLNNSWNEYSNEKQWLRTFRHFMYIILILKFWHAFLIYFYFCLSLIKFIETNKISFDVISSNYQNSIYLIWFYIFSYILVIKKKLYFLIAMLYKMTYVQINFTNFFDSLFNEFNIFYIF